MVSRSLCVAVLMFVASVGQAQAGFVSSRGALAGNDFVSWGQFGAPFTSVSNPSAFTSNLGVSGTLAGNSGFDFERRDQSGGWAGNFANGDQLLWTNSGDSIVLDFGAQGITKAGAQIQQNTFGAFTGRISAFDDLDVLLGSFTLAGNSISFGDNSAIFLGVENIGIIHKIEFTLDGGGDFAINQFDFSSAGTPPVIPEPASLSLIGLGVVGMARIRMSRRSNRKRLFTTV